MATHEARAETCLSCKYYFPYITGQSFGFCFRHAPRKIDSDLGAVGGQFALFQKILDDTLVTCGEYAKLPGYVPPVVP
jgi:hypothetical protein